MITHTSLPSVALITVCILGIVNLLPTHQANAQAASASIEGKVINRATGAPLKNAVVHLGEWTQQTNDQGQFLFTGVADGRWPLWAGKNGFCTVAYGERQYLTQGVRVSMKVNGQIKDVV